MHTHLASFALNIAGGAPVTYWEGKILDAINQVRMASPEARDAARMSLLERLRAANDCEPPAREERVS